MKSPSASTLRLARLILQVALVLALLFIFVEGVLLRLTI